MRGHVNIPLRDSATPAGGSGSHLLVQTGGCADVEQDSEILSLLLSCQVL